MTQPYFIYTECGTERQLDREGAIAVVRDKCGLMVEVKPGATPTAVEVRQLADLTFRPVIKIDGRGWTDPVIVKRYGLALTEAAAIAEEAIAREEGNERTENEKIPDQ